jgi:hypothetical protein
MVSHSVCQSPVTPFYLPVGRSFIGLPSPTKNCIAPSKPTAKSAARSIPGSFHPGTTELTTLETRVLRPLSTYETGPRTLESKVPPTNKPPKKYFAL